MCCQRVLGIGVDIIEIRRFHRIAAVAPQGVAQRLYTAEELSDGRIGRPEYLASRFAAKEAVMKSLGCGMDSIAFTDIEVFQDEYGQPHVRLTGAPVRVRILSGAHGHDIPFALRRNGVCFCGFSGGGCNEGCDSR